LKKLRVAVLMGGQSAEREISLLSGSMVLEALKERGQDAYAIEIGKDGIWWNKEKPFPLGISPLDSIFYALSPSPDAVFIALHGPKGEDGTVQGLLEICGIPYTGSGVLASALGMDKYRSRLLFEHCGLLVPPYLLVEKEDQQVYLNKAIEIFGLPLVIKPNGLGSSLNIVISPVKECLENALEEIFIEGGPALIEKYLSGRELTVPVLGNSNPIPLPVIEIVPPRLFFDFASKYNGSTKEICPAPLEERIAQEAQEVALKAFQVLGCRGFARVDMVYCEGKIWVFELNTIPGLTKESLVPKSAKIAGYSFPDLIEKIIYLALEKIRTDQ